MSDPETQRPLYAVVLAAGEGSRMKSERPKPLHRLCGKPMLAYVLESLATCHADRAAIVVGHKGEWVTKKIAEENVGVALEFVEQAVQRGTGDAALIGLSGLPDDLDDDSDVIVLPGDTARLPVAGKVIWVTPAGAQGNKMQGIGVQFRDDESGQTAKARIETLLAAQAKTNLPTHTM